MGVSRGRGSFHRRIAPSGSRGYPWGLEEWVSVGLLKIANGGFRTVRLYKRSTACLEVPFRVHAGSLSPAADDVFEGLLEALRLFAPAREHFKTHYIHWEIINISRGVLYGAMPSGDRHVSFRRRVVRTRAPSLRGSARVRPPDSHDDETHPRNRVVHALRVRLAGVGTLRRTGRA